VLERRFREMPGTWMATETPIQVEWGEERTSTALIPRVMLLHKARLGRPQLFVEPSAVLVGESIRLDDVRIHGTVPRLL
jgi:hypothetical protein